MEYSTDNELSNLIFNEANVVFTECLYSRNILEFNFCFFIALVLFLQLSSNINRKLRVNFLHTKLVNWNIIYEHTRLHVHIIFAIDWEFIYQILMFSAPNASAICFTMFTYHLIIKLESPHLKPNIKKHTKSYQNSLCESLFCS